MEAVSTITEQEKSNNILVPDEKENEINQRLQVFISAWRSALKGNQEGLVKLLAPKAVWDNPLSSSATEYLDALKNFPGFFSEPGLTVTGVRRVSDSQVEAELLLSFWYPTIWRPRITIPTKALITFAPSTSPSTPVRVISVKETWAWSVPELALKQLVPRAWDVFHLFTTPVPEQPQYRVLGSAGLVEFVEVPPSVVMEVRWRGPANITGPPLQVLPDLALFGELETSKRGREPFDSTLPPEVRSARYTCARTGRAMKESVWTMLVPSHLHEAAIAASLGPSAASGQLPLSEMLQQLQNPVFRPLKLRTISEEEASAADEREDDQAAESDYQVGLESLSVMKGLEKGSLRGNFDIDYALVEQMQRSEEAEYALRLSPRRLIAQTTVFGTADADKIKKAFQTVKDAVATSAAATLRTPMRMRGHESAADSSAGGGNAWLGLGLHGTKVCFNARGEPGMAVYEIQFGARQTKVFAELEEIPQK